MLLINLLCTMACFHTFCLLSGDFIQLQKLMGEIKIVKTVAINLLSSIDPS
ncbi:hypothetical protein E2C01_088767 [Portunus trituberculatus]|uniref:Uncharacterized protein n=1 Tax=Portunus trituberculatus TaxID=210409 RepID=A0A5B7JBN8_PORTR|nr:hypothetical protein [Portunus trituberculatus]